MRLLHTGDWHVGRTLRGRSRHGEHEAVLDEMVRVADEEAVDVVVVAGDLFDSAAPPPESERLVYSTLLALAGRDRHVLVIAGNHDHPRRLAAVEPLLDLARVHVRPFVVPPADGGVVTLDISGEALDVAFLPWLSQRHAVGADELMAADAADHQQTYAERLRRIAGVMSAAFRGDRVNLVVGHCTVVGGEMGGGERSAHTILDYAVPSTIFPITASYVALGHLHRCQKVAAGAPTWYAGSPLQLDFGEGANVPSVNIVDLAPGRPARVTSRRISSGRPLHTVLAAPADLDAAVAAAPEGAHLRVIVQGGERAGMAEELRERFPAAVEVKLEAPHSEATATRAAARAGKTPRELFATYLAERNVSDERLITLFDTLHEEAVDGAS